jgi:mRNA interferase MazF
VKRGEVWIVAGGTGYSGKPRPAVIVQDDAFEKTASVTICPITGTLRERPLTRLPLDPTEANGLRKPSQLMIDKLGTVPRAGCAARIGELSAADVARMNRAMVVLLGLGR